MSRIKKAMPSPAMLVAIVALVAALGGTAVAEVATTSLSKKDTKKVKKIANKQGKKQANKQIDKKAPGLSVASAATAESAKTAEDADTANGLKPVKVDFAATPNSGPTTFVSQGGVQVDGECDAAGHAELNLRSTAVGGIVKLTALNETGTASSKQDVGDFDPSEAIGYKTGATYPERDLSVAVSFRGADGTTLTGDLLLVDRVLLGPNCRIAATLLVA